jgi:hypothetical protein
VDEQDAEVTHCLSSWRSALALQDVDIERNHTIKLEFAIHRLKGTILGVSAEISQISDAPELVGFANLFLFLVE